VDGAKQIVRIAEKATGGGQKGLSLERSALEQRDGAIGRHRFLARDMAAAAPVLRKPRVLRKPSGSSVRACIALWNGCPVTTSMTASTIIQFSRT
jgi:hypothetical protein